MLLSTWPSLLIFAALWGVFYRIAKLADAGGAPAGPTRLSDGPVPRHRPATTSAGWLDVSHGSSITFEFQDLPSARRACDNHYFLFGMLSGDRRAAARDFLAGMQANCE